MKIKTLEMFNILSILDTFVKLNKFFPNQYKNFVRFHTNGDGNLYLIVNNCVDIKIIQKMSIDKEIIIDKIYAIIEVYNIVKNILNYPEFILKEDFIYFDDGKFSLVAIDLPVEKIKELYNINVEDCNSKFSVDGDIENEIKTIFKILNLKSDCHNSYFYRKANLLFNFNNIFIKKQSMLSFMVIDIFSLRLISVLLLKNKKSLVEHTLKNDKLILKSENFYVESNICIEDESNMDYLENYFENIIVETELEIKLEFFNFIEAINYFDDEASILFKDRKIFVASRYKKFVAEFTNIDNDATFIIANDVLFKILNFVFKMGVEEGIKFKIVNIDRKGRFIYFNLNNIEILTEII